MPPRMGAVGPTRDEWVIGIAGMWGNGACPGFYNLVRQWPTEPIDVVKDGGAYVITTRVPVEGGVRVLITCRGGETLIEIMAFGYYNYTTIKDCVRPVSIAYRNYVLTIRLVKS